MQTWICTVHTQDLKPTVLPQYIDEMRSRSGMAKKTHSHSPPLSFFFQVLRFWVLKWVLKWYLPLFKKNKKNHLKNLLVETSACQKKTMRKSAPQKIHQHEANQKNTAKIKATLQRALHDIPQHFSVGGGHRWSCHFLPTDPGFCPQSLLPFLPKPLLKYTRAQMPSECPLSHPFSNEFSFGPCNCLFNFIQTCPTN